MPLVSTNARTASSHCAYAAPLPRMINGFFALRSTSSARATASAAGICAGAASITLTRDRAPAAASITCENSLAGRSRYTPPGRPETAARIARATPIPISAACSTRNAALHSGFAIASWSISS